MTTTAETVHGLFIGGEWVAGTRVADDINPSDVADVVGRYAQGDASHIAAAVAAAKGAAPFWASSTPQQRFDVLDFVGSEILARKEELGTL
ncbi:MAG TPA: aldehyde dehydrogenase family protein, partial [Bacteroidota bacterium]